MKVFILCLFTLAVVSAAVLKRQCEDSCTPGVTPNGCHFNQLCIHTNCGAKCHFILPKKRAICPLAMCNVYCPYGHKLNADGCMMCGCNPSPVIV